MAWGNMIAQERLNVRGILEQAIRSFILLELTSVVSGGLNLWDVEKSL